MSRIDLEQIEIFHGLSKSQCQALLDTGEIRSLTAGTIILNEGDQLDSLYVLLEGRMEAGLPKTKPRFTAVRLSELGPGQCFGEYALIDQQPASATIRAVTDAEVCRVGYDVMHAFLDAHPAVASVIYQNLLRILVQRLRASNAELDLFTLAC